MRREQIYLEAVFYLTIILSPLGQCFLDFNTASFPQTAKDLGASLISVQNTLTIYSVGFSLGCFVLGIASDYWGRRAILLSGLSLAVIGAIGSATAPDINALFFTRFIQGLGCGSVCVSLGGTLRNLFSNDQLKKRTALAAFIGPILFTFIPFFGSLGQHYLENWRILHWVSAFILFLALLAVFKIYPSQKSRVLITAKELKLVLTHKGFQKNTLIFSSMLIVYAGYLTLAPSLFLLEWKWSEQSFGFVQLYQGTLWILGAWFNHRYHNLYTPEQWILGCLRFLALGFTVMLLSFFSSFNQPFFFLFTVSPIFLCLGPLFSHTFYRTFEPFPDHAGLSGSLYRSCQFLFYGVGSWVIAQLPQKSFNSLACIGIVVSIIMLWLSQTPCFYSNKTESLRNQYK